MNIFLLVFLLNITINNTFIIFLLISIYILW